MAKDDRCPVTKKPWEFCCQGRPWARMTATQVCYTWGEPLPQVVIDKAVEYGLEPHVLMDGVEDRGWETHDKGFDEQVLIEAQNQAGTEKIGG